MPPCPVTLNNSGDTRIYSNFACNVGTDGIRVVQSLIGTERRKKAIVDERSSDPSRPNKTKMRRKKKTAKVTGGIVGIGQAISIRFAQEGAAVVADFIGNPDLPSQIERSLSEFGGKCFAVEAGVSKPDRDQNLFSGAIKAFGGLDIVVNNAGVGKKCAFVGYPSEDLQVILAINLVGPFLVSQAAACQMIRRGKGGRPINISSVPTRISRCLPMGPITRARAASGC